MFWVNRPAIRAYVCAVTSALYALFPAIMTGFAEALQIVRIKEQRQVTLVGLDVVSYRCSDDLALICTALA